MAHLTHSPPVTPGRGVELYATRLDQLWREGDRERASELELSGAELNERMAPYHLQNKTTTTTHRCEAETVRTAWGFRREDGWAAIAGVYALTKRHPWRRDDGAPDTTPTPATPHTHIHKRSHKHTESAMRRAWQLHCNALDGCAREDGRIVFQSICVCVMCMCGYANMCVCVCCG